MSKLSRGTRPTVTTLVSLDCKGLAEYLVWIGYLEKVNIFTTKRRGESNLGGGAEKGARFFKQLHYMLPLFLQPISFMGGGYFEKKCNRESYVPQLMEERHNIISPS